MYYLMLSKTGYHYHVKWLPKRLPRLRHIIMAKDNIAITTVTQIDRAIKQAIKAGEHNNLPLAGYKGLELRIRPKGNDVTTTFRHRYTHPFTGKRPYMTIGQYPAMKLEQARQAHNDNMRLLAQSIDPITYREQERLAQAAAINNGFTSVADSWLEHMTSNKNNMPSLSAIAEWQRQLAFAIKAWGNMPVKAITTPMVLSLCRAIQKDRIETGRRVRSLCERVFAHAIGNGLLDMNPAMQVKGLLLTPSKNHMPALETPLPFGQLIRDIDQLPDNDERTALQLMALLFTRSSDMCEAKWTDIDFNSKQWTLKPKKGRGRSDMVDSLIIPLPAQAVAILKSQYDKTGMYDYVFYNHRRKTKPYLDKQRLNLAINSIKDGYYINKHVPHGFRASAITMIQEQLKIANYLPDMQSGHAVKDSNGTAYNRAKFIEERTEMMQAWADYQDELRAGTSLIRANFKQSKEQKQG